ncbi:MAG TPA: UDP-galactopyranose mutase [Candidatus Limiplasma sp.]|nr:UDP-galactopyranose mutase [Candidatus Limiplasma sp.]
MYDYLVVGAGLAGSVAARELTEAGKKCLVVEKRSHIGGNVYTRKIEGIDVHCYGAHIFHTDDTEVWAYVNRFAQFNRYTHMPLANYMGELYNLPFNMNTFHQMWGVATPEEAAAIIAQQRQAAGINHPRNLEEQAISLVGTDIYEKLIKGYTEKQWGRACRDLPVSIINRLPVRFTYDNNYFNSRFQGIPADGYTAMIERLLAGINVWLHTDYLEQRDMLRPLVTKVIYTGGIDAYFAYAFGPLEYRSIRLETETLDMENFQGNAVVNYTDRDTPYTRIIEHKHFNYGTQRKTVISREYSSEWQPGSEAFYPVNNEKNHMLYQRYADLALDERSTIFTGRLGLYRYLDMDAVVRQALDLCKEEMEK